MGLDFDNGTLIYEGKLFAPSIRTFSQMKPVLAQKEKCGKLSPGTPLYYMYRTVHKFGTIRYDITRIPSFDLCGEFNKTYGHSHPPSPSGGHYPEAYEVLEGAAHFLIQRADAGGKVSEALLLSAKKGDCFLVPPGFGHVTINPTKKELVLANLVSESFQSDYSLYEKKRGACFYEMKGGEIVKNKNYPEKIVLRKEDAVEYCSQFSCFSPFKGKSLLWAARAASQLEFLEKPEKFR